MDAEFTVRQVKVPRALRELALEGLERIGQILGKSARASLTFSAQRHLQIVELTVQSRLRTIAATGKADSLDSALRQAMAHAEHQARRYRDRKIVSKRLPKEEKVLAAPPVARPRTRAAQPESDDAAGQGTRAAKARALIAVHSFPAREALAEPHVLESGEALAVRPMSIEEAVKEVEFRDRDLLIFRSLSGDLYVLHRRRDGQMELVAIP